MTLLATPQPRVSPKHVLLGAAVAAILMVPIATARAQDPPKTLRIGSSGSLTSPPSGTSEQAALDTLRDFIKDQTAMNDEIVRETDWRALAEKMTKGNLHLGVFQGYEFAWAQAKYPGLRPVAVAVNVYTYPTVYVVTRKEHAATNFAGLQGQSLTMPAGPGYLRLFIDRQCEAQEGKAEAFFSQIATADNVEDAVDDLVDGKVQAVAADKASLEAYKKRKPGRFNQLKAIATSAPFPPTAIVTVYDKMLDQATLQRVRDGLLRSSRSDRGQTLLTVFRLTSFQGPPEDLDRVLTETRKTYPAPDRGTK
jgi:ABC-type phosphate/phosphonate transport system substrate-binding protein